ncbi:hypothetical protein P7K49_019177 [Saguinus oedipus]|uniref:Uncharacterized protein n=1 Tax=Saguinus oedipus TaxID=9490 RepID=A0ABQ9UXE2_SAGOE|nr:hypothetical protein P7K49_019177 [Saguinus oedipus]
MGRRRQENWSWAWRGRIENPMLGPAEANRRSLELGLEKPTLGHLGPIGTLGGQKLSLERPNLSQGPELSDLQRPLGAGEEPSPQRLLRGENGRLAFRSRRKEGLGPKKLTRGHSGQGEDARTPMLVTGGPPGGTSLARGGHREGRSWACGDRLPQRQELG